MGKKAITKKEAYWNIQTLDSSGGNVGRLVKAQTNAEGQPYCVYLKGINLNTVSFNGQSWQTQESPLGIDLRDQRIDLELDHEGNPHALYLSPNGLQYVYRLGTEGWAVGFISEGAAPSMIWDLDLKNHRDPSFVFEDKARKLRLFERHKNLWREAEVLADIKSIEDESFCVSLKAGRAGPSVALAQNKSDGSSQLLVSIQGKSQRIFHWVDKKIGYCQLQWDSSGALQAVFLVGPLGSQNGDPTSLVHGSFVGGAWSEQLLMRDVHSVGAVPLALTLDNKGQPHIVYFDLDRNGLVYLHKKTERFWPIAPIVPLEKFSGGLALAVDSMANPSLFFRNDVSHEFKVAVRSQR